MYFGLAQQRCIRQTTSRLQKSDFPGSFAAPGKQYQCGLLSSGDRAVVAAISRMLIRKAPQAFCSLFVVLPPSRTADCCCAAPSRTGETMALERQLFSGVEPVMDAHVAARGEGSMSSDDSNLNYMFWAFSLVGPAVLSILLLYSSHRDCSVRLPKCSIYGAAVGDPSDIIRRMPSHHQLTVGTSAASHGGSGRHALLLRA